jgi:hypothetical protein
MNARMNALLVARHRTRNMKVMPEPFGANIAASSCYNAAAHLCRLVPQSHIPRISSLAPSFVSLVFAGMEKKDLKIINKAASC